MAGRADIAAPRKSQRRGRERGCWVYIPAETLTEMGIEPLDLPPRYTMWPAKGRPRLIVNLEKEGAAS